MDLTGGALTYDHIETAVQYSFDDGGIIKLAIGSSAAVRDVRKIILFGFDGFGNPRAFKDTPVWDATEFHYPQGVNKSLSVYYKKEAVLEERRIGYQDERASDLHSNCPTYNDQYHKTLNFFCKENNLVKPEVVNCSPEALYTVHKKISYDQLKGEVDGTESQIS